MAIAMGGLIIPGALFFQIHLLHGAVRTVRVCTFVTRDVFVMVIGG